VDAWNVISLSAMHRQYTLTMLYTQYNIYILLIGRRNKKNFLVKISFLGLSYLGFNFCVVEEIL